MATQSHDIRLIRIVKILNCIKQDSEILASNEDGVHEEDQSGFGDFE